ncbi:APC amino acid permease, partial [Rhizoctonia solani AG-3 Rhs1AP]
MAIEPLASEKKSRVAQADEDLLASLGYKQEFKRAFTPFEVFGIAFSIIALVPSIASSLVYSLPYGGPVSMVWGWLAASVMIMFVGLALAELASAAPTSGGLYFWTWTFSPPRYKKVLSWLVGYANTLGSMACIASIDWGCAVQVTAAATIGSGGNFVATTGQTYGIYLAILFTHAVVCSLATEVLARLQSVYVILNLILFFGVLIALPAATPSEFMNTASFALGDFTNCAYDSCVHISEEASNAAVAVPWAIIGAIGISGILGTAMNIAITFCMGTDLEAIVNSDIGQPLAVILFNSFGQKATLGIWSVVVLTQWGMGSSIVLATSRQVFAFSRDGAMPFSNTLYCMNSYTKTPVNTVWFSVFIAALLGLLAFAGEAAIAAIFSLSVIGLYIAYSIPIGARFLFKGHNYKPGPFNLGAFGLPVAIIAIVFMTFVSVVFLFPTDLAPAVADMNYAVVVLGGVMIGCLIWYWFPKYGGVNWFEGPVVTVDVLPQTSHNGDKRNKRSHYSNPCIKYFTSTAYQAIRVRLSDLDMFLGPNICTLAPMATPEISEERRVRIANADEELLASLGYKQEFKRTFTPFEVFGVAFSIISLVPSIASSLVYAMPNGGPASMVWGWFAASIFIMFVGLAMAELASAAPTSGGLYFWTWTYSSPKYKKILAWLVGYANTIGTIAGIASIDWGCAVQVMAAAAIGSGGKPNLCGVLGHIFTHAVVCSLATSLLARLQTVYVILNLVLFLAILIALPAATPAQFKNSASYALGDFTNLSGYPNGFAFFLSWLAPVWTIGSYDCSVHISEEASNAAVAVPWSIVGAIGISGILGTAMNIAIAFSVWFSVIIAALLGLLAFAGEVAIMAVFSYIIPIGARFVFNEGNFTPGPFTLGPFGLPVAAIAIAFMSFITIVLLFPSTPAPGVTDMNYAVVVMGGVMVGSVVWYYFPKYGGVYWFEGPISTIVIGDGASSARTRAPSTISFDKSKEKNDARVTEREIAEESV